MPTLTKEQARALAQEFFDFANSVGNFRLGNSPSLSRAQMDRLESLEGSVRNTSSDLTALAIKIEMDDLEDALDSLGKGTKRMRLAIKHLKKVNSVLKISAAVVTVGAAIVTGNPAAIFTALEGALATADEVETEEEEG